LGQQDADTAPQIERAKGNHGPSVAEGVGATVVPELAVQRGAYPRLRVIPLGDPVVSRTLALLTRAKAHLTPTAQALYDLIRNHALAGSV
jgi:DNA-binding transcriptional LysR family regulator